MNRIGGKSNTGEGGEDEARFLRDARTATRGAARSSRSRAARFGVTAHYLVNADELQIKIAQGAKPGEGGQLPGHKVDEVDRARAPLDARRDAHLAAAAPRHLLDRGSRAAHLRPEEREPARADQREARERERASAPIAAGVAKAHADVDPHRRPRRRHRRVAALVDPARGHAVGARARRDAAGARAERPARARACSRSTGSSRPGATSPSPRCSAPRSSASRPRRSSRRGCIMMRKCHLNTCPVGIATQDPVLRARFTGTPEHVINYFFFVAEELRAIMARLGFRTLDEMVGRVDCIVRAREHRRTPKARTLDFSRCLACAAPRREARPRRCARRRTTARARVADRRALIEGARLRVEVPRAPSTMQHRASRTRDRAFGAHARGRDRAPPRRRGAARRHDRRSRRRGTAGQSFGAFAARGHDARARGRRERLRRQGPLGRRPRRAAAARGRASSRARQRHRRQHRALRRDERRARSSPGARASASRCATAARSPSSKASAITAAST